MGEIESYIVLLVSSVLIRYSLIYSHQPWAKSYSQTITFLLLPIITYTITMTIAGNIALSLGMIGALSIVRFRTPIKEPEELVYLFFSIAIGIGFGAGQTLITSVIFILISLTIYFFSSKKIFQI